MNFELITQKLIKKIMDSEIEDVKKIIETLELNDDLDYIKFFIGKYADYLNCQVQEVLEQQENYEEIKAIKTLYSIL